jgi:pyruvate formate lyase activating enzyme
MGLDPIEKKPLYHFYPGRPIFSVAPNGCNLRCPNCQNWEISQRRAQTQYIEPESLIELAKRHNSIGIAYTYTEPLIWFEYLLDVGRLVHDHGLLNVLVTNGMIEPEPLSQLLPLIDAWNIDLKAIRPQFYKEVVKGDLAAVKHTIQEAIKRSHVELTNLLIPTLNDSEEEIAELIDFVAGFGPATVLHFSRYFPAYRLNLPSTPIQTLLNAYHKARERLYYVYLGNLWGVKEGRDTLCPNCGELLVARQGFEAQIRGIDLDRCRRCGRRVDFAL